MRKRIIIVTVTIIGCLSVLIAGCNIQNQDKITKENQMTVSSANNNEEDIISQLEYGKPVCVTVAYNNKIYEITYVDITSEKIGIQIGSVNRQVSPKPEANGDIARNTSEGQRIIKDVDGKLYEIKGIDSKEQIAIEISKGVYYQCKYLGKLK